MKLGRRTGAGLARVPLSALMAVVMLAGCATEPRTPYSETEAAAAIPIGERDLRYWADASGSDAHGFHRAALVQKGRPFVYLALSGGGGGGAYGAGVLNGWSRSGGRPEFTVVSGVSTGALIAPFAFLGADYDEPLKQLYTNGEAERLVQQSSPLGALLGPGAIGRNRLRRLVARYLSDDMIQAIAREDRKGRRLLVVTTNLDAQRAMVWDMGAIANSPGPGAFDLFRDVLAASASVPVLFAPQLINVNVGERVIQEMHADGALTAPVYTMPDAVLLRGKPMALSTRPALYVLVNDRIDPSFALVPNGVEDIAMTSFSTLNRVDTKAVLALSYQASMREGMSFHVSYIGRDFAERGGAGFDTPSMRSLYDYGFEKASSGSFWISDLQQSESMKARTRAPAP